jgi:hypothetical protein
LEWLAEKWDVYDKIMGKIIICFLLFFIGFSASAEAQGFTVPAANGFSAKGSGTTNAGFINYSFSGSGVDIRCVGCNGTNYTGGFWFPLPSTAATTGTTTAEFEVISISGTGAECNYGRIRGFSSDHNPTDTNFVELGVATATGTYSFSDFGNTIYGVGFGIRNDNSAVLDCNVILTSLQYNGVDVYEWFDELPEGGSGGGNVIIVDNIGSMTSEWECTVDGDTTNCLAIATSTTGLYNGPNFQEWLFVAGVIVFILSFMFWGRISFTNIPKRDNL